MVVPVIRQSCSALAALLWFIAGPASYAQSLDPHKPAPLGPGVNKGNVDGGTGSHYYYFLAGPGHVNVKMAFKEMGIFGNARQEVLSFDFYNESGKLMSHYAVVSFDRLERIETGGDFGSRQKIVLAIVPQKGLVRLGGYYEVEVTGAGTFDRSTAVGPDVTPRDTSLVHPGGPLVRPGGALLAPGQGVSHQSLDPHKPAPIDPGVSLDSHKPVPLGPGVNKGNVDGGTGSHYYYFLAGPGHVNVKMAFLEMGLFGNPRQEVLSFDFYNESGELISHNAVVSFDHLERIETGGDFGSRQKIVLAIVPQKGLVRLGGYYEVEVTGAGTFDRGTAVGPDVTPRDTSLVHPGGPLVRPGGPLLAPGQGVSHQ